LEDELVTELCKKLNINYRFVKKPLDNNEIKQAVAITIARYKINIESRIARMLISQSRTVFSFQQ